MKKTTVYLPDELDAWLEQLARTKGTSKAELIREALRRYVETSG
ncbi:MAG TPA: CopG family transcriptional regulator, partial [Oceanithermus profundus]|nr:CopG family transcriptional regulator [Oceanithermus profundus]